MVFGCFVNAFVCHTFFSSIESRMEGSADEKLKQVKLPYFHRTLSPEDTALIGDITPKAIPAADLKEQGKLTEASAWNAANTWEERDCTNWAIDKLTTLFSDKNELATLKQYKFTVNGVTAVKGNAQIAHVRGKPRFIYDVVFDLKFSIEKDTPKVEYKGKISVADVMNDLLDDIDLSITWSDKKSPPGAELVAIRNAIVNGAALKEFILKRMAQFEEEFTFLK